MIFGTPTWARQHRAVTEAREITASRRLLVEKTPIWDPN
jgi:hypothetical protein